MIAKVERRDFCLFVKQFSIMAFSSPPEVLLRQALRYSSRLRQRLQPDRAVPSLCAARTYKTAVCTKLGQPLEIQEHSLPSKLDSNEVLISVHSSGINFADILTCKGLYQERPKLPFTPGREISGKVVDMGSDVTGLHKGDRVFSLASNVARNMGGASEFFISDSKHLVPVPDKLSLVNASATFVSYGTAMMALTRKAKLKKKETVLVTAAAGATGMAAVDIARNMFDCQVIAVCGGQEKCNFMKERGATHAIDYTQEKIRHRVKELTGGKGIDVVMDQVGGDNFVECIKSLAFEGRALTVGYASGKIPTIPANLLLLKSASVMGVFWGNYAVVHPVAFFESINQVTQGVTEGKLTPFCGTTFPLEQINEAYQHILDKKNIGKIVLKMREEDAPASY